MSAPDHLGVTRSPPLAPSTRDDREREQSSVLKHVKRSKAMLQILKPLPEWTDKELAERARTYPLHDPMFGDKLAAEIDRRRAGRSNFWGFLFAALAVFGIAALAIVALHLMSAV